MNILAACEESQRVCMAFREKGHRAFSCDVIDCSGGHPEWHIKQDVIPLLNGNCEFKTCDGAVHKIDGDCDICPFSKWYGDQQLCKIETLGWSCEQRYLRWLESEVTE